MDKAIGNIDVQIIDNGYGFDLTDPNYPTFGRFSKWFDNSKGQNNKGLLNVIINLTLILTIKKSQHYVSIKRNVHHC